jgi:hypothetical protein
MQAQLQPRGYILFNMTTNTSSGVIPSAFYNRRYTIDAGSSANGGTLSSGTVTTPSSGNVIFEGGSLIRLLPNFRATATSTASFQAFITSCDYTQCLSQQFIIQQPQGSFVDPASSMEVINNTEIRKSDMQIQANFQVSVYPNPTSGIFQVIVSNAECNYELTNITGQILLTGTVKENETLDITEYPTGIYFIKVTNNTSGLQSTHKIIKQ